jgi:A/G-specific adenine glycosylase
MWKDLNRWYRDHARDLPWRHTRDPYKIWLSEVILQQTRVEQGLPYYERFISQFPDVKKLAKASNTQIMKLWQGLGYYSRAINMHETAKQIVRDCNGKFPNTYINLLKLKGIGPYTAAAIASFAFDEPKAVVDGNVFRVLSRVYGIDEPIDGTVGKKLFGQLADEILDKKAPAIHNQAMMELGATVCTPKRAKCAMCPMQQNCVAFIQNRVYEFPVKLVKKQPKEIFLNYILFIHEGKLLVRKRDRNSIWKNLYEPLYIESSERADTLSKKDISTKLGIEVTHKPVSMWHTVHLLSHRKIDAGFWLAMCSEMPKLASTDQFVTKSQLQRLPVHRLFDKFLKCVTLQALIE